MATATSTLGDAMEARDAERFVGRDDELADLADLLEPHSTSPIVYLHGPPGIGKSALAREFARRAADRGWVVHAFDGRSIDRPEGPVDVVSRVGNTESCLVVFDPMPTSPTGASTLREKVLRTLPMQARVLLLSRQAPGRTWIERGWETVVRPLELGPLPPVHARKLIRSLGIERDHADDLLKWGRGEPLALILGADHLSRCSTPHLDDDPRLARTLLERILDDEGDTIDEEVLRLAGLVSVVDRRMLSDVLHDVDAGDALTKLGNLSIIQERGRVSLHSRTRWAMTTHHLYDDPAGDRALRRRTADHLHDRVTGGEPGWLPLFAELFRDPGLRWAFAADVRDLYRIDRPRGGDADAAAQALEAVGTAWWAGVKRWFDEAPETVTVVRDRNGKLCGFCVLMTPASAPGWAVEDAVIGPRLRHAAKRYPAGDVVLWRDAFGFPSEEIGDPAGPFVIAMHGAINRSGRIDGLGTYGTVVKGEQTAHSLATAYGAVSLDELRVVDGERIVECRILHHGFGGYAGGARALVYGEIGLTPPPPSIGSVRGAVRAALRNFDDPVVLATSPLASGATTRERSESVRALIIDAINSSFGQTPEQQIIAAVVERGYLRADGTHETAAREMHLGRSTYFRHLAVGVDRITTVIDEHLRTRDANLAQEP